MNEYPARRQQAAARAMALTPGRAKRLIETLASAAAALFLLMLALLAAPQARAQGGNDIIIGGTGADVISTAAGNNILFGDHARITGVVDPATYLGLSAEMTVSSKFTGSREGGAAEGWRRVIDHGALVVRGQAQTELAVMPGSPADLAGIVEFLVGMPPLDFLPVSGHAGAVSNGAGLLKLLEGN